ncbi:MAG: class I SAM-dependent methyltransferase [Euryarchaeota archaeon]|nr:class I SAM-dependent methyltransferase [Euryarchaeota archaeon]
MDQGASAPGEPGVSVDISRSENKKQLNLGNFKKLLRHPSLLLHAFKTEPELAVLHMRLELPRAQALYRKIEHDPWDVHRMFNLFRGKMCNPQSYLYPLCRHLRPDTFVETGVHYGGSTAFILQAMRDNGEGHLYSIDLPNAVNVITDRAPVKHGVLIPDGTTPGFVVPQHLRDRWTLILGDARVELPRLVDRLDSMDVFLHDSLHTAEHMRFEYETAWPKIRKDGLLLSDDVDWNDAFPRFCREKGAEALVVGGLGFATKRL